MSAVPKVEVAETDRAGSSKDVGVAGPSGTEGTSGGQTQYVLTSADGQEVIIDAQALEGGNLVQGATVQVVEGGQEVTYALQAAGDDDETLVSLGNRSGGDTMEIISSDGTTYTTNPDGTIQRKLFDAKESSEPPPSVNIDQSFQYYDNIRGKINNEVLNDLVAKYDAENPGLSKNDRLHQWGLVAREYCQVTGQTKSRTTLMKKMTSAKYYRDHDGRAVEARASVKGQRPTFKTEISEPDKAEAAAPTGLDGPDPKRMKLYDQMRLEALRLERDAQKANLENAQIEGDKLSKESKILDVQLEIMKIELAIRKEEAIKAGVVFEMVQVDEGEGETMESEEIDLEREQSEKKKRLKT